MIEIQNLKKSFDNLDVLQGINLTISKGQIYGLVGRSGAGKSTLLRCINGLETYDGGSLLVDGVQVGELSNKDLRIFQREIGMIFQNFSLLSRLSVYDNIALPMRCWKYGRSHIDRRVKELAELVGIGDKLNQRPTALSGGQKQRVAIARALTMDPKILLCDEATSALDPKTATAIINLLIQINQELGITMVLVTHQMSVLRRACEEISILEHGRMAESGRVEEVFLRQPPALRNLIGDRELSLPEEGVNLQVVLSKENSRTPIITQMARDLGKDFLVLGGEMEQYRSGVLGSILINLSNEVLPQAVSYLNERNVIWRALDKEQMAAAVEQSEVNG